MKRLLTLLTILCLVTGLGVAQAADGIPLGEKLQKQVYNGSGLSATATLSMTGTIQIPGLDEATGQMLPLVLSKLGLDLRYIQGAGTQKGKEEIKLKVLAGDQEATSFHYLTDRVNELFESPLLGDKPVVAAKGSKMLSAFLWGGGADWPGLERAILTLSMADNAWKAAAEQRLVVLSNKLSLILKDHTVITPRTDVKGQTDSVLTLSPAQLIDVVDKTLAALYEDQQLLSLLREQLTHPESAAYLQPEARPLIVQGLKALPLTGNLVMARTFDTNGKTVTESLSLPMGGVKGLVSLLYNHKVLEGGRVETDITLNYAPQDTASAGGRRVEITMQGLDGQTPGMDKAFAGTLTLTPEVVGYTVQAVDGKAIQSYDWSLTVKDGEQTYQQAEDLYTKPYALQLTLTPKDGADKPLTLAAEITLTSQSDGRKATRFSGKATLSQGDNASLVIDLSGQTTPPWAIPLVEAPQALRPDSMSPAELKQASETLKEGIMKQITGLLARFVAPALPTVTVAP